MDITFMWEVWGLYAAALCVWREASGEGREGMAAVASVIQNRAKRFTRSLAEVVCDPAQFSSMTIQRDPGAVRWPRIADASFAVAFDVMQDAAGGKLADHTGGATFYRNPQAATSEWFQREINAGRLIKAATIGHHDFYREA